MLVFGVFDFLHAGHVYFLDRVKELGDNVILSLAKDEYVLKYKNKNTNNNFENRKLSILEKYPEFTIVPSDDELGEFSVIKNYNPDIIALGYDQEILFEALINSRVIDTKTKIVTIESYLPEMYKTSLL